MNQSRINPQVLAECRIVSTNFIFLIPQPPPRFFSNLYNPTFTLSLFIQPRLEKNTEHWVFPITSPSVHHILPISQHCDSKPPPTPGGLPSSGSHVYISIPNSVTLGIYALPQRDSSWSRDSTSRPQRRVGARLNEGANELGQCHKCCL